MKARLKILRRSFKILGKKHKVQEKFHDICRSWQDHGSWMILDDSYREWEWDLGTVRYVTQVKISFETSLDSEEILR
jgi:hypothetical protein